MADLANIERENGRLLFALKRVFRRLEEAEAKIKELEQERDEAVAMRVQVQEDNERLRQEAANFRGNEMASPETANSQIQKTIERLLSEVIKLRTVGQKKACAKCKKAHPEDAKACTLEEAIDANDLPSKRAYLAVCDYFGFEPNIHLPLFRAAQRGFTEIAEVLLRAGAKHEEAGNYGAVHCACIRGYTPFVRLLLQHGVDINIRDSDGDTPLHVASLHGQEDTVRLLLENNCDATFKNKTKKTALDIAKRKNCKGVVQIP